MQQRAVRGRCVPYQEDLMERPRRRRLPDKRALVKQLLCSAKMASGNGVGTAPVARQSEVPCVNVQRKVHSPPAAGRQTRCAQLRIQLPVCQLG